MKFQHSSLCVSSVAMFALALPCRAQQVVWTFVGSVGDQYGAALLQTADQNNDGYADLIVGAPGWNGGRGYVRALSGKFLATGTGSTTLWTLYSGAAGAHFGSSIIEVATLTGDSATDYLVSAPDTPSTGAVWLIDGSTHQLAWGLFGDPNTRFGASLASVGDQDGDGKIDFAVTAPSTNGAPSQVHVVSGTAFSGPGPFSNSSLADVSHSSINSNGSSQFGSFVASGFDLDHDGRFDFAIGSPDLLSTGNVMVCRADGSMQVLGVYGGAQVGERMGASIDGTQDIDGDGTHDLVIGAPNWSAGTTLDGRAVVVSGARLLTNQSPYELFGLRGVFGSSGVLDIQFGTCVRASDDLNADGVPDIIVGGPGYGTVPFSLFRGSAVAFSGASGMRMGILSGLAKDGLGYALLGGALDMNGDGFPEFAVAGPLSDNPTADCGTLKFYSLFPAAASTYCTAKINSLGCTPSISASGTPSANPATAFSISCSSVINQVSGLYFYSHLPKATAFQGGTMCVKSPLRRTALLSSGGNASGTDCSGVIGYDFGARIHGGVDPTLVSGAEVFVQCWSRDSASPSTTSLSNALRFVINP